MLIAIRDLGCKMSIKVSLTKRAKRAYNPEELRLFKDSS